MKITSRTTRRSAVAVLAVGAALSLTACQGDTANQANSKENDAQATQTSRYLTAQPVPSYDWSQIRQTLIDVEGAQAKTVQTTSFFFHQGLSDPYLVCNSIGFPVSATTELTNPQQIVSAPNNGYGVINQPDPTGVYTGQSQGTYVICILPNGKPDIQYAEPLVHTTGGPAVWDRQTHSLVLGDNPTIAVKVGK